MKFTFCSLLIALFCLACTSPALAQSPVKAKTETGKEVLLFPNGTWSYVEDTKEKPSATSTYKKSPTAKTLFKTQRGSFGIWFDEGKWKKTKTDEVDGKTYFHLIAADGYAMVISEGLSIPIESLKNIALENFREAAPDAKIVFDEKRIVNGTEVLCLRMDGTTQGIPFSFFGYYFGGKEGTIQLVTYTGQNLMDKYKVEFTTFLNGLEIFK
jgi:hypothetical protein